MSPPPFYFVCTLFFLVGRHRLRAYLVGKLRTRLERRHHVSRNHNGCILTNVKPGFLVPLFEDKAPERADINRFIVD